jgi:hypothetical protein
MKLKTYPVSISFDWIKNKGQHFEDLTPDVI